MIFMIGVVGVLCSNFYDDCRIEVEKKYDLVICFILYSRGEWGELV